MMKELLKALYGPVATFIERALVGALHIFIRNEQQAWILFCRPEAITAMADETFEILQDLSGG